MIRLLAGTLLFLALAADGAAQVGTTLTAQRGHRYGVAERDINQYDETGALVNRLSLGTPMCGIAWGPDGLLYAVVNSFSPALPHVRAMQPDGTLVRTHLFTGVIWSALGHGGLAFDHRRGRFYVGTMDGIYRFEVGGGAGTPINTIRTFDLNVASNGDLYANSGDFLLRLDAEGVEIERNAQLTVNGQPAPGLSSLAEARGIVHDAHANLTYVTMFGIAAGSARVLVLDGIGPELLHSISFPNPVDLTLAIDGSLLLGSRNHAPTWFDTTLQLIGQGSGEPTVFVTAYPDGVFVHASSFGD